MRGHSTRSDWLDLNGNGIYEVIATVYSGYTLSPRGVYAYSYDTGALLWSYQMGPTPHLDALADFTHSGKLDIVISTFAPCNGYSAGTTNDYSVYVLAIDPNGQVLWNNCLDSEGQQSVRSLVADVDGNGALEVVAFVRSDPVVDPNGPNNIYILNGATGVILKQYTGSAGDAWSGFSLSSTQTGEFTIFADSESGKLYAFDSKLNIIAQTNIGGTPIPLLYGHQNGEENNDGPTIVTANLYSGLGTQVAILVNRPSGAQQVSVFDATTVTDNSPLTALWSQKLPGTTSNNYFTTIFVSNLGNGSNDILVAGSPGILILGPSNSTAPSPTPSPTSAPQGTPPIISSVSEISTTRLQTIHIRGSGFGNVQPQLLNLSDGSVDTVGGGGTPVFRIYDLCGLNSWEAGVQDNPNSGADGIGVILASWTDKEIVLGGFGTAVSTDGQSEWNLSAGDPLLIAVLTSNGQAVYTTSVVPTQADQNSTGEPPVISSVSPIAAARLQTIVISGSGFGNIPPQLMNQSDGSVRTMVGGTTPVLRIYNEGDWDSWEAGCQDSQLVPGDTIGIYLTSWSDNEIVLGGFGTDLNVNGQRPWNIAQGDPLIIDVLTSNGQAAIAVTVVSGQPNQTSTPTPTQTPTPTSNTTQNLPTPTLSVSCQSSTIGSNFKVRINGSLVFAEKGLSGVPIQLSYSVNGGTSWNDLTLVSTDSGGGLLAIWTPFVTGEYLLKAEFAGSANYSKTSTIVSFAIVPFEDQTFFSVNSTLSEVNFNSTSRQLTFTVSGPPNTTGYVDVYIPKTVINDVSGLFVYFDGNQIPYAVESAGDSWLISMSYHHSTHEVVMKLESSPAGISQNLAEEVTISALIITPIAILTVSIALRKRKAKKS